MNAANADVTYAGTHNFVGVPFGTFLYFFAAGPGVDPNYSGTTSEAYNWGWNQAVYAASQYSTYGPAVSAHLMFMDVEKGTGKLGAGTYNGWNSQAANCGQSLINSYMSPSLDQATFNGFQYYIMHYTSFWPGAYSSPSFWNYTFGAGSSYGSIPTTFEWTSESESSSVTPGPSGWCMGGTCAGWFGGSNDPLAWQWSTSALNGAGDFDQTDSNNY